MLAEAPIDGEKGVIVKNKCSLKLGLVLAVAVLLHHTATANTIMVDLGSADKFAVLAGAGITVAGAVNTTSITGDIGTYPTPAITGFGNVVLTGVNHADDSVTQLAKNDLTTAYNDIVSRLAATIYGPIKDLGGLTLLPGVYNDPSSFAVTGTLTLDAQGDPNAVWIFQAGSTLTTASSSDVALINGAQADNVFWQVGSSATLGTSSSFSGNILADQSISADTGATIYGRLLAENGAVTLDNNTILRPFGGVVATVPEANTSCLFGIGLVSLFVFKRFSSPLV